MRDVDQFSAGSVLAAGFSLYFRNLPLFGLLTAIGFAPYGAYKLWSPAPAVLLSQLAVEIGLLLICGAIVQGGLTYGVVTSLGGNSDVDLRTILRRSIRVLPRILLLSIVAGLIVGLGLILLVVPGIILGLVLFVAVPASVMEGGGINKALKRSSSLTSGHKGSLFGVSIAIGAPAGVFSVVLTTLVVQGFDPLFAGILDFVISDFLFTGLFAACAAVAYHDLRIVKDGVDTEEVAAAFD